MSGTLEDKFRGMGRLDEEDDEDYPTTPPLPLTAGSRRSSCPNCNSPLLVRGGELQHLRGNGDDDLDDGDVGTGAGPPADGDGAGFADLNVSVDSVTSSDDSSVFVDDLPAESAGRRFMAVS